MCRTFFFFPRLFLHRSRRRLTSGSAAGPAPGREAGPGPAAMEQRGAAPAVLVTTRYRGRAARGAAAWRGSPAGAGEGRKGRERRGRSAGRPRLRESRVVLCGFAPGQFRCSPVFLHFSAGADPRPCCAPFPLAVTPVRAACAVAIQERLFLVGVSRWVGRDGDLSRGVTGAWASAHSRCCALHPCSSRCPLCLEAQGWQTEFILLPTFSKPWCVVLGRCFPLH